MPAIIKPACVMWVFLRAHLARCMFYKFELFFSILFPLTQLLPTYFEDGETFLPYPFNLLPLE